MSVRENVVEKDGAFLETLLPRVRDELGHDAAERLWSSLRLDGESTIAWLSGLRHFPDPVLKVDQFFKAADGDEEASRAILDDTSDFCQAYAAFATEEPEAVNSRGE